MDQLVLDCNVHNITWIAIEHGERCPLCSAEKERDALVAELVGLFGWDDKSYLHAFLHVKNAVLNLRADLGVANAKAERGEG
jgi:hypothetical protein